MRSSRYKARWKFVEQKNYKNNPVLSLTTEDVKENRTKKKGHTGTLALGSSDMPVHASLKIHLTIHVTQNNDMESYPV